MSSGDATMILHLLGFIAGIVLYAMLAAMTIRSRRPHRAADGAWRADRIPLATAGLGLLWNAGALLLYARRDLGVSAPSAWMSAAAFAALGFLPALVVHSSLTPRDGSRSRTATIAVAYALSIASSALHLRAAAGAMPVPSHAALLTLTVGCAAVIALLLYSARGEPRARRVLPALGLAAFAVMTYHLSQHAASSDSWAVELVGHHASLPLALVILYQDYRFALADIFLKRVLTLLTMLVLAAALYTLVAVPLVMARAAADPAGPAVVGVMLALWIATALIYPTVRRLIAEFVDRVILGRADFHELRAGIVSDIAGLTAPSAVLDAACARLAPALSADHVSWIADRGGAPAGDDGAEVVLADRGAAGGPETVVRVPTADPPAFQLQIGRLSGGRRLLSGDFAFLESVALLLARRIDALRAIDERYARDLREREMRQLATEAELTALRAQLNPHFLFNALTTIGHLIREAPTRALETLYRLTGLLRVVLKRADGAFVTLDEELEIVRAYLAIESARFEDRLRVTIEVAPPVRALKVPPLILQPLVENAVKHGISPAPAGGSVTISARGERVHTDAGTREWLLLEVRDTGIGATSAELARRWRAGIGLSNIARRLEHYYGADAVLELWSAPGEGTRVRIRLPADAPAEAPAAAPARGVA